jgi:dihydroneopterin aldolase
VTHTIEVRDLRVVAVVGVLDHERSAPQPLRLDLDVELEVPTAALSDDVTQTVDYAALCVLATTVLAQRRPALLETACDAVGSALLDADARVTAVSITVTKLRPPLAMDVATVGVRRRVTR